MKRTSTETFDEDPGSFGEGRARSFCAPGANKKRKARAVTVKRKQVEVKTGLLQQLFYPHYTHTADHDDGIARKAGRTKTRMAVVSAKDEDGNDINKLVHVKEPVASEGGEPFDEQRDAEDEEELTISERIAKAIQSRQVQTVMLVLLVIDVLLVIAEILILAAAECFVRVGEVDHHAAHSSSAHSGGGSVHATTAPHGHAATPVPSGHGTPSPAAHGATSAPHTPSPHTTATPHAPSTSTGAPPSHGTTESPSSHHGTPSPHGTPAPHDSSSSSGSSSHSSEYTVPAYCENATFTIHKIPHHVHQHYPHADHYIVVDPPGCPLTVAHGLNHALHTAETVLQWCSRCILWIFGVELLILLFCLRTKFLCNIMYDIDFVVVYVSITLDLVFWLALHHEEPAFGLLVFVRLWRFCRIMHGVGLTVHDVDEIEFEAELEEKMEEVDPDHLHHHHTKSGEIVVDEDHHHKAEKKEGAAAEPAQSHETPADNGKKDEHQQGE